MRITVRTDCDRYVDVVVNPMKKEIVFLDPIPNTTTEELMDLVDQSGYSLVLPITSEVIKPDKENNSKIVQRSLIETLYFLTALSDVIVAEN